MKHNSKNSVIYVGDCGVDVIENQIIPGGCGLNFTSHLAALNDKVSLLSWVGTDRHADIIASFLKKSTINYSHLHKAEGTTAYQDITIAPDGNRHFTAYHSGVLKEALLTKEDLTFIAQHTILVTLYYSQLDPLFKQLQRIDFKGLKVMDFMDGTDFGKNINFLKNCSTWFDIAMFGLDTNTDAFFINQIKNLAQQSKKIYIITLGAKGSTIFIHNKVFTHKALSAQVIDTTGCGDAFLAGFIHAYSKNKGCNKALKLASRLAAHAATHIGGTCSLNKAIQ